MRLPSVAHSLVLVGLLPLLTTCRQVCDEDSLPRYPLTASQRAWADPYPKNAVLRFRNASGYVRTYQVVASRIEFGAVGGSKSSLCADYHVEHFHMQVERTDSAGLIRGMYQQNVGATVAAQGQTNNVSTLQWASSYFDVPISAIEEGRVVLGPATFAGRTYQQVLELRDVGITVSPMNRSWYVPRLFLTKADGVIRFEERGGMVWDRL